MTETAIHHQLKTLPPRGVKRALKRADEGPRYYKRAVEELTTWIRDVHTALLRAGYPEFAERFKADPPEPIPSEEEIAAQSDKALVHALRAAGYPEFAVVHEAKGRKITKATRRKQVKALRDAGYDDAADLHEKGAPTGLPPDIDSRDINRLRHPEGYQSPWTGTDGLERQFAARLELYDQWTAAGALDEQRTVVDAADFGASADQTPEENHAAISAAMDAAREQGGGQVVSPVPLVLTDDQVLPLVAGHDQPLLVPHVVTLAVTGPE